MDIQERIDEVALRSFGITTLKPFQRLVVQDILEALDKKEQTRLLVILSTGMGKSLCFLIPSLICKGISIVVFPLLSLLNDQLSKLKKLGIQAVCLRGGQTKAQREDELKKLSRSKILITNPETLSQKPVLEALKAFEVSLMVIDEAHVASLWGKTFRASYLNLGSIARSLEPRALLSFTATASASVIEDIKRIIFSDKPYSLIKGDADRPNIYYGSVQSLSKLHSLRIIAANAPRPLIVFCRSRKLTSFLADYLKGQTGLDCRAYHAGLSKPLRQDLEAWFLDSKDGLLVATNAYGMGVDKKDLRTVVHYELPSRIEDYLQESGRCGRDGLCAWAWILRGPGERESLFNSCIRANLLRALGSEEVQCSGCDFCMGLKEEIQGLDELRRTLIHHPLRYDEKTLFKVLSGQGPDEMESFFSLFENWTSREVIEAIDTSIKCDLVKRFGKKKRLYWGFKKTSP